MEIDTEAQEAKKAIYLLGGKVEQVETFCLPGSDLGRSFVVIRKVSAQGRAAVEGTAWEWRKEVIKQAFH